MAVSGNLHSFNLLPDMDLAVKSSSVCQNWEDLFSASCCISCSWSVIVSLRYCCPSGETSIFCSIPLGFYIMGSMLMLIGAKYITGQFFFFSYLQSVSSGDLGFSVFLFLLFKEVVEPTSLDTTGDSNFKIKSTFCVSESLMSHQYFSEHEALVFSFFCSNKNF